MAVAEPAGPVAPAKFISFTTTDRPVRRVRCLPGDGPPQTTDGHAVIEAVARPHLRGLTRERGWNPIAMDIPILLDGYRAGRSVESAIAELERMSGLTGQPHTIMIDGTGSLVPHSGLTWYITGIEHGEELLSASGERLRVAAVVSVVQVVQAETEKSIAKRTKAKQKHASSYRVKKGDTLRSISRKVYGTPDRWDDIRRANSISDPRIVGTAGKRKGCIGTTLRMPE
jgi:LysM domain